MGWRSKGQKWEAIRRTHVRRISPEDCCPHSGKSEVSCLCRTLSSNLQDEGSECVASAVDRLTGCTAYFNLSSLCASAALASRVIFSATCAVNSSNDVSPDRVGSQMPRAETLTDPHEANSDKPASRSRMRRSISCACSRSVLARMKNDSRVGLHAEAGRSKSPPARMERLSISR